MNVKERIQALRKLMQERGLAAYVVPSTDPHASEYVADCWQRRVFISGFDGSAGTVVVTLDKAGLWTDSRYFLQADQQLAGSGMSLFRMGDPDVSDYEDWLASELKGGDKLGLDPKVFTVAAYARLEKALQVADVEFSGQEDDLVEQVWGDERPAMPKAALRAHPLKHAGESGTDKLKRIRGAMREAGAGALAVGALDEIAWALNMRGADVDFNPVFIAFLLVEEKMARLFVDTSKLSEDLKGLLPADLKLEDYGLFGQALAQLGAQGSTVWMDPQTINQHSQQEVKREGGHIFAKPSPISAWKAVKNQAELKGFRAAHKRDALAMIKFLRWLETAVPAGGLSELNAAARLGEFRAEAPEYIGPSFETISGYGPHGAIVHYRVNAESDIPLKSEGIYLVDSGGQYEDGTTDITRTMALGTPTAMHTKAYTAVLQGHLQLFRSIFPEGTNGYQLDVLARAPVWAAGLNYGHGTGHGVGAALCVHEGPFSVSPRKNMTPLAEGHVLSIEPGYYKTDDFGMRVENLAEVVEVEQNESGCFLGFKPLTLCPYARQLIDKNMLNPAEMAQIDDYHKTVLDALSGELDEAHRAWLTQACRPL